MLTLHDIGPWQFGIQWYAMCVLGIVSFGIFLAAILPGVKLTSRQHGLAPRHKNYAVRETDTDFCAVFGHVMKSLLTAML